MRKRMIYGFFVLAVAVVLALLYYGMKNDAEQSNSHIIPPDLNSAPFPSNNVLESVQNEESQVFVEEPPEHLKGLQVEEEPQPQSDTTAEDPQYPTLLKGRRVTLEDKKEIIILESVPDSWKTETEVHFDKEGKAHVTHRK